MPSTLQKASQKTEKALFWQKVDIAFAQFGRQVRLQSVVWLAISFAAGVALQVEQPLPVALAGLGFACLLPLTVFYVGRIKNAYKPAVALGRTILVGLAFLCLGVFSVEVQPKDTLSPLLATLPDHSAPMPFTCQVVKAAQKSRFSGQWLLAETQAVQIKGQWVAAHARIKLNYPDSAFPAFVEGTELRVYGQLAPIQADSNVVGPRYNQMLLRKNVHFRCRVTTGNTSIPGLQVVRLPSPLSPYVASQQVAQWTTTQIKKHMPHRQDAAMAVALLLGDRTDIDAQTTQAYQDAGATHLLAVSGMHVGLFYVPLIWLVGLLPLRLQGKRKRNGTLLIVVVLWGFAFVTGLQPSIVRAVVMFCFLQAGKLVGRRMPPLYALALSAIALLVVWPYQLFDVGFQLSYAALAGIFVLGSPLANLGRHWALVPKYLWSAFTIGLGAQAGAGLLAMYYFHQWPVYGVLVNIPLAFLSSAALLGALGVALLGWVPILGTGISVITGYMCQAMTWVITTSNLVPGAVLRHIYWPLWLVLILFALIIQLVIYTGYRRSVQRWTVGAILAIFFVTAYAWHQTPRRQNGTWLVFNGNTAPLQARQTSNILLVTDNNPLLEEIAARFSCTLVNTKMAAFHNSMPQNLPTHVWAPASYLEIWKRRKAGKMEAKPESVWVITFPLKEKTRQLLRVEAEGNKKKIIFLQEVKACFIADEACL